MTYKIVFVDEESKARNNFLRNFIHPNRDKFDGIALPPKQTIEEMIEVIFENNPDLILTDFSLNDFSATDQTYRVEYDGGELACEILDRRENFPIFIATSLGGDAARKGYDVKLIYEKYGSFKDASSNNRGQNESDGQHLTFADKVLYEIKSYKNHIEDCSKKFDLLIEKRSTQELSHVQEVELIRLDGVLERAIDKKSSIDNDLKNTSNSKKLENLLLIAQKILDKTND